MIVEAFQGATRGTGVPLAACDDGPARDSGVTGGGAGDRDLDADLRTPSPWNRTVSVGVRLPRPLPPPSLSRPSALWRWHLPLSVPQP